jgi:hypothetical protein
MKNQKLNQNQKQNNYKNLIRKFLIEAIVEDEIPSPEAEDTETEESDVEDSGYKYPMELILTKFESLDKILVDLMTDDYKNYVDNINVVAPKPTTFKVDLKNGQNFMLTYDPKSYIAKISGKKYYLKNLGEFERGVKSLADLLAMGKPQTGAPALGGEQSSKKEPEIPLPSGGSDLDKLLAEPETPTEPTAEPGAEPIKGEEEVEKVPEKLKEYIKKQVMNILKESEENNTRFKEDNRYQVQFNSKEDLDKAKKALNEPKSYGKLVTTFTQFDPGLKKHLLNTFGPSIPAQKINAEKARGSKFPIKTSDGVIDAVYSYYTNEKSGSIIPYEEDDKTFRLYVSKNDYFSLDHIKQIINEVMKNAGIKFKLSLVKA